MNTASTLALFRQGDELLLAKKKRGFGKGYWNGPGGKVEPNESIGQALVRECQEEVGLTPTNFYKVAEHDLILDSDTPDAWHMYVHVYFCTEWQGEPAESDEMSPQWFKLTDIPYETMWQDDPYWLPNVLQGDLLKTIFTFGADNKLLTKQVQKVERFV